MNFENEEINNSVKKGKIRNFNINFGPQHPAAHGVLRMDFYIEAQKN